MVEILDIFRTVSACYLLAHQTSLLGSLSKGYKIPVYEVSECSLHHILCVEETTASLIDLYSAFVEVEVFHEFCECDGAGIVALFLPKEPISKKSHEYDFWDVAN